MKRRDDYWSETIDEAGWDAEMSRGSAAADADESDAIARFLDELRALAECEPPAPSPELMAAFARGNGSPRRMPVGSRRHRRAVLAAAAAAAAVVSGVGSAAAAHQLPAPAQRFVSHVIQDITTLGGAGNAPPARPSHVVPTPARVPAGGEADDPGTAGAGGPSDDNPGSAPPGVGRGSSEPADTGGSNAGEGADTGGDGTGAGAGTGDG